MKESATSRPFSWNSFAIATAYSPTLPSFETLNTISLDHTSRVNIARHDCIHGQIASLNSKPFIAVSATTYNLLKKPERDYSLSLIALEELARRFAVRPISCEQGIETCKRIAVEDHVHDVISELCKIRVAQKEFQISLYQRTIDEI